MKTTFFNSLIKAISICLLALTVPEIIGLTAQYIAYSDIKSDNNAVMDQYFVSILTLPAIQILIKITLLSLLLTRTEGVLKRLGINTTESKDSPFIFSNTEFLSSIITGIGLYCLIDTLPVTLNSLMTSSDNYTQQQYRKEVWPGQMIRFILIICQLLMVFNGRGIAEFLIRNNKDSKQEEVEKEIQ